MRGVKRLAALTGLTALAGLTIAATPALASSFQISAHTSFDRTYTWSIQKTARNPQLVLAVGQTYEETYDVTVTNTGYVDSNWRVVDGIVLVHDLPFTATGVTAVIQPGNIVPTVVCPPGTFGVPTTKLGCTYAADLPDGSARTVYATIAFSDGSSMTESVSFDFTTDLIPGQPVLLKTCVTATDSMEGALGSTCVNESPKTFTYTRTIGPYGQCGEFTVENHAWLDDDPLHPATSTAVVHVTVPCVTGCTRTIGYWKNHAGFGPQADVVTQYLPISLGSGAGKTQIVGTAAKAVQFLEFRGSNAVKEASNGVNKLYAQLLGAKLNIAGGASGSAVASIIAAADAFLAANDSLSWASLSKSAKATVNSWMSALDDYNNGLTGPGHCDE